MIQLWHHQNWTTSEVAVLSRKAGKHNSQRAAMLTSEFPMRANFSNDGSDLYVRHYVLFKLIDLRAAECRHKR